MIAEKRYGSVMLAEPEMENFNIVKKVNDLSLYKRFQDEIVNFLFEICKINTTPNPDISIMRESEKRVFEIIKNRFKELSFKNSIFVERDISFEIENHPAFTDLHFTKTPQRPEGLDLSDVYKDRHNLLYFIDNESSPDGRDTALNAHIDVIAPFFPPEKKKDYIYGRGTVDDKGNIAGIYGALLLIDRLVREGLVSLKNKITAMFVIEEEIGGNGSLSLAIDRELKKRYGSILILESTGNNIYPANRGAVWFKSEIRWGNTSFNGIIKPSLLEGMVFPILSMQKEGDKIKSESNHPLFPHRPVQTCNGTLGPFGEHPSRICGKVSFVIYGIEDKGLFFQIKNAISHGVDDYIERYDDKTKIIDQTTGKKKVEQHVDITYMDNFILIDVYGSTGHMGSILENDDAIVKWAHIVKKIIELKLKEKIDFKMELKDFNSSKSLILEGGQGFLPTHKMGYVQDRMRNAFANGIKEYLNLIRARKDLIHYTVTYDKLHNVAFACAPESTSMKIAWKSGIDAWTVNKDTPVRGWDASCDARLFATEYPNMPVITSGAGELRFAHSDEENIYLPNLFKAIVFTTLFLLRETGSI